MVTLQVGFVVFFVLGKFGVGVKQEYGRELCADFSKIDNVARAKISLAVLPFAVFQFCLMLGIGHRVFIGKGVFSKMSIC